MLNTPELSKQMQSTSVNEPDANTEIEKKFNTKTREQIEELRDNIIAQSQHSQKFSKENPKEFYTKSSDGTLTSYPISLYLDDSEQTLFKNGANARLRCSSVLPRYFQIATKGNSEEFNGPGGSKRHEDEKVWYNSVFKTSLFSDPKTHDILQSVKDKPLFFYFQTHVTRPMIGFPVEVNGKKAIFEISFDEIDYMFNNPARNGALELFDQQNQIEIEYFNPNENDPKIQKLVQTLNLSSLTYDEIEIGLKQATSFLHSTAKKLNIELIPHKESKGSHGFAALEQHSNGNIITPYYCITPDGRHMPTKNTIHNAKAPLALTYAPE